MQDTERFIRRFTRGSGMPSLPFSTESWITGKLGDLQAQNPPEHLFVCSLLFHHQASDSPLGSNLHLLGIW